MMSKIILLLISIGLYLTACKTQTEVQKESEKYVRERYMWEMSDIVCDSIIYRYVFIGCMESSIQGWNQTESECKAYALSKACKIK